jgi:hypothetical protein
MELEEIFHSPQNRTNNFFYDYSATPLDFILHSKFALKYVNSA